MIGEHTFVAPPSYFRFLPPSVETDTRWGAKLPLLVLFASGRRPHSSGGRFRLQRFPPTDEV